MSERPHAAFQGAFGAFSHEACLALLPDADPAPYPSFQAAFEAVRTGACAFGVIPSENSIAGPVPEVAPLLAASGLRVLETRPWPIRMHLMGVPGGDLTAIKTVASHPMALKQCGRFLRAHGFVAEAAYDTAGAAQMLAATPDPTRAVVAAAAAAELYGLEILSPDVQDRADNVTRFLVLALP